MSWESQDIIKDTLYAPQLCGIYKREESFKAITPDIFEHILALRNNFRTESFKKIYITLCVIPLNTNLSVL